MSNSPGPNSTTSKLGDRSGLTSQPQDWNYETTVARVEAILAQIEAGELDLADVFEQFSTAVEYLRQCEAFLAERQKQVGLLIETLTDDPEF